MREDHGHAVRNALRDLRKKFHVDIIKGSNPVTMRREQPHVSVDLWDFFLNVEFKEYGPAAALIAGEREPCLLEEDSPHEDLWEDTFEAFREAKEKVMAAIEATSGRNRSMLGTREQLLDRSLVPGVGRQVPIREVRSRIEPIPFPWRSLRPDTGPGEELLPEYFSGLLDGADAPRQLIVVGAPGAGKTLTAISTYLRLTDRLGDPDAAHEARTVLYVDAHTEGSQPEFATDSWLEGRLGEIDAVGHGRPVVIMSHADAFLSRPQLNLEEVLGRRLYRDCDVLLCCSEQFYSRGLQYEEYGTHVVQLESWDAGLQRSFALALFDQQTCDAFEAWRDADETRQKLCVVPLHLAYVLPIVEAKPEALERISTRWHLFDQVARVRLRVAHQGGAEDDRFNELAAVAHRFYMTGLRADRPIGFNLEELRDFLQTRNSKTVESRLDAIVNRTLLTVPEPGSDEFHFEEPSWGWFFVASHLANTVMRSDPPEMALKAFSKFLSTNVMELCEEMLREGLPRHEDLILGSLRFALFEDTETDLSPGRRTIAREQVGYLLGMLGDSRIRADLAALMDREASTWEPDHLVRRGIAFGLANGGAAEVADSYVQALREDRELEGSTPERDANIGFHLSFRGDQLFEPEHPGRIGRHPDPVRTVADLVRGLDEDKHRGSWRIKLFTLVDLGQHPAIAPDTFERAVAPHLERLHEILERREADPQTRDWVELAELREVLDEKGIVVA
jgi:hypothetical protein